MQKNTSSDNVASLPTPLTGVASPGFWNQTNNPALATTVTVDWLNSVQEEICNVIINAGITLDVTQTNQLFLAIRALTAIKVIAPLTIFVNASTGNDANNGLTSGSPFRTIAAALANATATYNLNNQPLTISLANGTYSAGVTVSGLLLGQGAAPITISGTSPSLCTVNSPSATNTSTFGAVNGAALALTGMTINSSGSGQGGFCVVSQNASTLTVSNVTFGTAVGGHMIANFGGVISIVGNYNITGPAPYHMVTSGGSIQSDSGSTIVGTVSGNPHFSVAFVSAGGAGNITFSQTTYVGTATGINYTTPNGGSIVSGGGNGIFPSGLTNSTSTNLTFNSGWFS